MTLAEEPKFYDDVYFADTEDETDLPGSEARASSRLANRIVPTNDELFYDPAADDRDVEWVTKKTQALALKDQRGRPLPHRRTNDTQLSCPLCMTVVCFDCQRHERYGGQYRAMFVENCQVAKDRILRFGSQPTTSSSSTLTSAEQQPASDPGSKANSPNPQGLADEAYHPVECRVCNTEIAVMDEDEVYHFFHVIAS
ncbi:hypothetical protein IWQ60_001450 [Tieghemiomyces parasiticus]|uniref:E2F-associated phosphoprotein n=1 Tax=Tieghemiomyces parasiticus TaxID=78921 RepID=A0A9W8AD28_9FUNG|nr:hypothetical protein IWQ60_001450 [Tieghemiomyces parasiticus]